MNPQSAELVEELEELGRRAHRLAEGLSDEAWMRRPQPERWSAAEQVAHLNVTSVLYLTPLHAGIDDPAAPRLRPGARLRGDVVGSLLAWMMEPPIRIRLKTTPPFVPGAAAPKPRVLADFDRLQGELLNLLRRTPEVDLGRVRLVSPFNAHIKYSAYSAFRILAAHQRRHLWLAEQLAS